MWNRETIYGINKFLIEKKSFISICHEEIRKDFLKRIKKCIKEAINQAFDDDASLSAELSSTQQ